MRQPTVVLFLFLLTSCTSTVSFDVRVDAISSPTYEASSKTFTVIPGEGTSADLQFEEYRAALTSALESEGFLNSEGSTKTDLLIRLSYGIGNPETINETYSTPQVKLYKRGTPAKDKTTTYQTHSRTLTTYNRYAVVSAYVFSEDQGQELTQLWQTTITSTGSSGDLRRVFPFLMKGAQGYFGINTGQQIQIFVQEDSGEAK